MKRTMTFVLVLTLVCGLTVAVADAGGPGCAGKSKDGKIAKTCDSSKRSCELGAFPAMVMKVGDKTYECPAEAGQAAAGHGEQITYWVCDQSFTDKNEAIVALAAASEKYVEKFTRIGYLKDGKVEFCADSAGGKNCPGKGMGQKVAHGGKTCGQTSGEKVAHDGETCRHDRDEKAVKGRHNSSQQHKFYVLGREFKTWDEAVQARDEAVTAMKKTKMTYLVDGKEVDGCEKVCPKAKADGKVQFVVGETKTNCENYARCTLARCQYEVARSVGERLAKL